MSSRGALSLMLANFNSQRFLGYLFLGSFALHLTITRKSLKELEIKKSLLEEEIKEFRTDKNDKLTKTEKREKEIQIVDQTLRQAGKLVII